MSRESAPTSSINDVERVTCSLFTPRFSQTISMTRSSTEGTIQSSQSGLRPTFERERRRPEAQLSLGLSTTAHARRARHLGSRATHVIPKDLCAQVKRKSYNEIGKKKRGGCRDAGHNLH